MRSFIPLLLFIWAWNPLLGQTSLGLINLKNGSFNVGYKQHTSLDYSRTYQKVNTYTNAYGPRPMPISIWYPSTENTKTLKPLSILNYFEILKQEEEWEHLPNEQLLNWFYYSNTPTNQAHLKESTSAFRAIIMAQGKFPVVIYNPSYQASSIENFALCEYLASHGFIVLSTPSRGAKNRWIGNNYVKEIQNQAQDVGFLIQAALKMESANANKIAVVGFSFGGLSNVLAQMANKNIKAVLSLDGTERYRYTLLSKAAGFSLDEFTVPYMHLAQKNIPKQVLEEDNIPAALNSSFKFYDSITNSNAYKFKFNNLTHSYFSTLGVLFSNRDLRQDKSDIEIMESYALVCSYSLYFLEAFLKDNTKALTYINSDLSAQQVASKLVTKTWKQAVKTNYSFLDFNELALAQDYKNLNDLLNAVVVKQPNFKPNEGNLNTLGLQLVFNPNSKEQGIRVLEFATGVYPNSANLFDSLAEAYLFVNDTKNAILNFNKSLVLNPKNQNAINRIQQLKE